MTNLCCSSLAQFETIVMELGTFGYFGHTNLEIGEKDGAAYLKTGEQTDEISDNVKVFAARFFQENQNYVFQSGRVDSMRAIFTVWNACRSNMEADAIFQQLLLNFQFELRKRQKDACSNYDGSLEMRSRAEQVLKSARDERDQIIKEAEEDSSAMRRQGLDELTELRSQIRMPNSMRPLKRKREYTQEHNLTLLCQGGEPVTCEKTFFSFLPFFTVNWGDDPDRKVVNLSAFPNNIIQMLVDYQYGLLPVDPNDIVDVISLLKLADFISHEELVQYCQQTIEKAVLDEEVLKRIFSEVALPTNCYFEPLAKKYLSVDGWVTKLPTWLSEAVNPSICYENIAVIISFSNHFSWDWHPISLLIKHIDDFAALDWKSLAATVIRKLGKDEFALSLLLAKRWSVDSEMPEKDKGLVFWLQEQLASYYWRHDPNCQIIGRDLSLILLECEKVLKGITALQKAWLQFNSEINEFKPYQLINLKKIANNEGKQESYLLAYHHFNLGEYDEALRYIRNASCEQDVKAKGLEGLIKTKTGPGTIFISIWEEGVEEGSFTAVCELFSTYSVFENTEKEDLLVDMEKYKPILQDFAEKKYPMAMYYWGKILLKEGDTEKAIHLLESATKQGICDALIDIGAFYGKKGDEEKKKACYQLIGKLIELSAELGKE